MMATSPSAPNTRKKLAQKSKKETTSREVLMDQTEQKNREWQTYYNCANSAERRKKKTQATSKRARQQRRWEDGRKRNERYHHGIDHDQNCVWPSIASFSPLFLLLVITTSAPSLPQLFIPPNANSSLKESDWLSFSFSFITSKN